MNAFQFKLLFFVACVWGVALAVEQATVFPEAVWMVENGPFHVDYIYGVNPIALFFWGIWFLQVALLLMLCLVLAIEMSTPSPPADPTTEDERLSL